MRIDAIYLVAPEPEPDPKPPSMPTRRAFLMTAGALVLGAGGGGACGYSMGVAAEAARAADAAAAKPAAVDAAGEQVKSSGDAELDYWRGVAQGPLDDLFEKALMFMHVRTTDYPQDAVLWLGVQRMVEEIAANPSRPVDPGLIGLFAVVIEGPAHPAEPSLGHYVRMLRERRSAMRRK